MAGSNEHPWRILENRYPVLLTSAVLALTPFIITSTAYVLYSTEAGKELHADPVLMEAITGIATAAYAFGALLGGDIVNRFPQRRLFLMLETGLAASAILAATAPDIAAFAAGNILQGLCTGILLVVALPPVIRRFPAPKMRFTSAATDIGFFGAVTAGPLIGGIAAAAHMWRWYYASLAALDAAVLLLAAFSLPDQEPQNPDKEFDWHALLLALGATVLPFYASSELSGSGFDAYIFTVPLSVGLLCFAALIVTENSKENPLAPVKPMWTTFSLIGVLVAMFGGGMFVTQLELAMRFLSGVQHQPPLAVGIALWPILPGVLVTAGLLGWLIDSRYLPLLVLFGMLCIAAGGAVLTRAGRNTGEIPIAFAAALLGLGGGATVSPGLCLAGFPVPSKLVGQVFALVERVRSVADYILAPVILKAAAASAVNRSPTASGIAHGAFYAVLITAGMTAIILALYFSGATGLPEIDLKKWLQESKPAFESPPLFAKLRRSPATPESSGHR